MPSERMKVMEEIAAMSGGVVGLAFSGGKDAIAAWVAMRESGLFTRIVPVYKYLVPGISFVEENLRHCEDVFETPIIRMPHDALFRWLRNFVFQPPERCALIEGLDIPIVTFQDIFDEVSKQNNLPVLWQATGVRAADSPLRRTAYSKYGAVNYRALSFMPIADMQKAELVALLTKHKIRLSPEYRMFGRTLDGISRQYLAPIREYYPDDYARIIWWFPLADLEFYRYQLTRRENVMPEIDTTIDDPGLNGIITAAQMAFRERRAHEQKRTEVIFDSEYWAAICFETREQKDAFLIALGVEDDKYVDGIALANKMNIELGATAIRPAVRKGLDKKLEPLMAPLPERVRQ